MPVQTPEPLEDLHLEGLEPLISPRELKAKLPVTESAARSVLSARRALRDAIHGRDARRLVVIVGPCSIHDPDAALEYAGRLAKAGRGAARRPAGGDAHLLREAAHDDRLEGPDQRPAPRRLLRRRGGPRARARPVARAGRPRGRVRERDPRSLHAAVRGGPARLGRHRRAHRREPDPSADRERPVHAGRLQERHRRRPRRAPRTR